MALRKLLTSSLGALAVLLLSAQSFVGVYSLPQPTTAARSSLRDVNRTVPDYVTRHAPLVWLHSEDQFRPSDILSHVRHTTPMTDMEPVTGIPELDLENLSLLNKSPETSPVALTANGNITDLPAWLSGKTPDVFGNLYNVTSCIVVLVGSQNEPRDVDAFYFYFYSYNRGANITQVLPPINTLLEDKLEHGMHFGDHVGDWEHNMVRFRDGKPIGIYFSQHSDGSVYEWNDAALSKELERPLVYSAIGSHANWVSPGHHVHDSVILDFCDAGQKWDPVSSAYFYRFDPVASSFTRMFRSESTAKSNVTSFLEFSGLWGDLQYPDHHPLQKTVPFFGLKRYVSGPTGPLTKQLVRKGLFPDHRQKKSWIQWGVRIFMSLYPCCFRGWRAWVSCILLIGVLMSLVVGILYAVKRLRLTTKGYKKLDPGSDVPLNSLSYRDGPVPIPQGHSGAE